MTESGSETPASLYLPPLLVLTAALGLAAIEFSHYWQESRELWTSTSHDRNAHFLYGMNIAQDLRSGDVRQLLLDFDSARVWPPLHGLVLGVIMSLGGVDHRLGVLPSLVGWIGAGVFAFLLARRAVPRYGNVAGFIAAAFILGSPAHRAFATDVMLESLGACLSLLALYLYLVTVQEESATAGKGLGLALTALCVHKSNYWLLVVFALTAAELTARPATYWSFFKRTVAIVDWPHWLKRQLWQPLNYLLVAVLAVIAWLVAGGGEALQVEGQGITLRSPHNVVTVAYAIVLMRVAWWWYKIGSTWSRQWDNRFRQVALWHLWPAAVWYAWPKRFSYLVWYLTVPGEHPQHGFWNGVAYYWQGLLGDYHSAWWTAALAAVLLAFAVITIRNFRPGAAVVLWFLLIGAVLTCNHTNRKHRFLHTWIPALWVAGGMGAAGLAGGRWLRDERLRSRSAAALALGVVLTQVPGWIQPGHAGEGGLNPNRGSTLDLTDAYLADLADAKHPAILSTMPIKHLTRWTYQERYRGRERLETDIKHLGDSAAENQRAFDRWLETTPCDKLVFVDIPAGTAYAESLPETPLLRELIEQQTVFQCVRRQVLPQYECTITVWVRK
jgi:hypothetical protein